jgi:hypothetical protein
MGRAGGVRVQGTVWWRSFKILLSTEEYNFEAGYLSLEFQTEKSL